MSEPRFLLFDIETTNLQATFGTLLCIGYKWIGDDKSLRVPTILETSKKGMLDDRGLVKEFANVWSEADAVISWYGKRFDQPFIESKLIKYKLPPLKPVHHIDLWFTARYRFKLHSNRLNAWQQYLDLPDEKTPIDYDAWLNAAHGSKEAIAGVVEHCRKDIIVLEEAFEQMKPWVRMPSLFRDADRQCQTCGSRRLKSWGLRKTRAYSYRLLRCLDCKAWNRERLSVRSEPKPEVVDCAT